VSIDLIINKITFELLIFALTLCLFQNHQIK
jgi:hypothetical protein